MHWGSMEQSADHCFYLAHLGAPRLRGALSALARVVCFLGPTAATLASFAMVLGAAACDSADNDAANRWRSPPVSVTDPPTGEQNISVESSKRKPDAGPLSDAAAADSPALVPQVLCPTCLYNGVCYPAGATHPVYQCQICQQVPTYYTWRPKGKGAPCNDGNACTQTDTCQYGNCVGSNPVQCTGANQCKTCAPATGLCTVLKPDGTSCSDGNPCTLGDHCWFGYCVPTSYYQCGGPNQCKTCDPASGQCTINREGSCDDGNACTQTDTCQSGTCVGSNPVDCTGANQCKSCNPMTGLCTDNRQGLCDDGNPCTRDTCQNGACISGAPVVCAPPTTCGGGGVGDGECGCTAKTCGARDCGVVLDGCGGTLLCPCSNDPTCGG
jgi:hypothetical protein